jgi:ribosomal protein L11 methyltransferase
MEAIQRAILAHIENSRLRVTAAGLERFVRHRLGSSRQDFRRALRDLVEVGAVDYVYLHGCSFIERAFTRPVRIGRRIVLVPHGQRFDSDPGDAVVTLEVGAAFGSGRHPSTRLALEGIEFLLDRPGRENVFSRMCCLDIGTGSGVLALATLIMGVGRAVGIDTDPCSLFEAKANARRNRLESRFKINADNLSQVRGRFDIVLANLRAPTLKMILPDVRRCLKQRGAVLLSGFQEGEEGRWLRDLYGRVRIKCAWRKCEKGWQAAVLFSE